MKTGVLLLLVTIGCASLGAMAHFQATAYKPLLIDDMQESPKTLSEDIAEAKKLGLFRDPHAEYDVSCPPSENYFSFIASLPVAGLQEKGLSRPKLKELADRNKWQEIDRVLEAEQNLLNRFANVGKLRRGFRSKYTLVPLDFPLTAKTGLALSLLLISAEREASLGRHTEAIRLLKQAITFTNLMADQPTTFDLITGRTEQARVLITINRIAYRLTNTPEMIQPYEALVSDWNPNFDYMRFIRYETNSVLKMLLAEKEHGMYSISRIYWKMDREAEDENGNEPPKLSKEEQQFLTYLSERAAQEKKLLPYTLENASQERPAWAVVLTKLVESTREKIAGAQRLADNSERTPKASVNPPTKLSEVIAAMFPNYEFGRSQEMFYTHKALCLTAMNLYRQSSAGKVANDLSRFSPPPTDFYRQQLRLHNTPNGNVILSVGRDGKVDPQGRREDDFFLPLAPPVFK